MGKGWQRCGICVVLEVAPGIFRDEVELFPCGIVCGKWETFRGPVAESFVICVRSGIVRVQPKEPDRRVRRRNAAETAEKGCRDQDLDLFKMWLMRAPYALAGAAAFLGNISPMRRIWAPTPRSFSSMFS